MAVISFAHTTPALLARAKSATRRYWSDRHARMIERHADRVDAYDKSPRNGGRKVAEIRVTSVTREWLSDMPDSDYEAEGFAWLHAHGIRPTRGMPFPDFSRDGFDVWRSSGDRVWVVRFQLISVVQGAQDAHAR